MVDDLHDFTKISCGKSEVLWEPVDVHEVVSHALEVISDDAARKDQGITVALDASCHGVKGDATRLQQVFWNLLENASKFTLRGGSIRISSRDEPSRLIVEVTNTGIGFEPELATRLFDAFTQPPKPSWQNSNH